jgi:hypothetical protein
MHIRKKGKLRSPDATSVTRISRTPFTRQALGIAARYAGVVAGELGEANRPSPTLVPGELAYDCRVGASVRSYGKDHRPVSCSEDADGKSTS